MGTLKLRDHPIRGNAQTEGPLKRRERSSRGNTQTEGTLKLRQRPNRGNAQTEGPLNPREHPNRGNAQIEGSLKLRDRSNRGNAQIEGRLERRERSTPGNAQTEGTPKRRDRFSEAASARTELEESKRRALGHYFSEQICYMFLMSKCRGDQDVGLCTTSELTFGELQRNGKIRFLKVKTHFFSPILPSQKKSKRRRSTYWPALGRGSWTGIPWGGVGRGLV